MRLFGPQTSHNKYDVEGMSSDANSVASINPAALTPDHVSTPDTNEAKRSNMPLPSSTPQPSPSSAQYSKEPPTILPLRQPFPYLSPPIMLIVGGPKCRSPNIPQQTFYVHAYLLTSISPFFRAAFDTHNDQAGFQESTTLTMRLPEERPEDVAFLLQWMYIVRLLENTKSEYPGLGLYHNAIDMPLQNMQAYRRERAAVQAVERHSDVSQLVMERPAPPAFGPLIRLYILADRLSVRGGLKGAICRRFREVGDLAAAVPWKGDVWRLWEGVPTLPIRKEEKVCRKKGYDIFSVFKDDDGPKQGKAIDSEEEDLKAVVLDMYADMQGWRVFENGDLDAHKDGEGFDWHPLFMRNLAVRLLREKRERREAERRAVKCKRCSKEAEGKGVSGGGRWRDDGSIG